MKIYNRSLVLFLSLMIIFQCLTACTANKENLDADISQIVSSDKEAKKNNQENSNNMTLVEEFTINEQPIASFKNNFIVRNDSGNLYGLINSSGEEILPCEFEKMEFAETKSKTIVIVQSKGSYGIYDLDGTELIPCQYTNINISAYEDLCIATAFTGECNVLNFSGEMILPTGYDIISFGYGKIIMAGKSASETDSGEIAAYDSNGNLIKKFPSEDGQIIDLSAMNGGNLICVTYMKNGISYTDFDNCLVVSGDTNIWSNTQVSGDYLYYFQDAFLTARNIKTGDEYSIWKFPEDQDWTGFEIGHPSDNIDSVTNISFVDFSILGHVNGQKDKGRALRVVLDDPISVVDFTALGINISLGSQDEIGSFYDGIAMVFPADGYLYTTDTSGQIVNQLKNPYTDRETSFLIDNAAILNNNGFYSIIDANGDTLLLEEGYSNIEKMMGGFSVVTDQSGKIGLINNLTDEILSCGEIESIETGIKYVSPKYWDLESKYSTDSELLIINKEQSWAVYSLLTNSFVTDFIAINNSGLLQYDYALGNGGFFLIDDSREYVYVIADKGDSYKVYLIN